MRVTNDYTFFWNGVFSNWYGSGFKATVPAWNRNANGIPEVVEREFPFSCVEQYMMYMKAMTFGDFRTAYQIMQTTNPKSHKALGRAVKNFDAARWEEAAYAVVYIGNHAKFTQNTDLLAELLATEGTTLVEASPYDKIWGIGMGENDAGVEDKANWKGQNLLGEVLTNLRDELGDIVKQAQQLEQDQNESANQE